MKFFAVVLCVMLKTVTSYFCYWNSGYPYKYFSDKTPYNNVRGDIRDSIVKLKGCEPVSMWALISDGKHMPTNFDRSLNVSLAIRDEVILSYELGNSSLCAQDVENIRTWSTDNGILSKPNFLTEEGSQELIGIANRLRIAFPQLLQNLKGNYKIARASGGVTQDSAKNFAKGFSTEPLNLEMPDDHIAPHKTCKSYQKLLQNPDTYKEVTKYKNSPEYLVTKDRMQRRLGITTKLSDDSIKSLYDMCRYTWSGIHNKYSQWCALFTTEDLLALEYIGDLENYYKHGYGSFINQHLGKTLLADLLSHFQEARDGGGKDFVAYFTDTATLNMVATALDLFRDYKPLGSKRDPQRKWRNSKISVFSANLIAVLHRCSHEADVDYNVVFYWNEEPLLPICERGFCAWDEFNHKLHSSMDSRVDLCNS